MIDRVVRSGHRTKRVGRSDRADGSQRDDRTDHVDCSARGDRIDHAGRGDRGTDHADRSGRVDRRERGDRAHRCAMRPRWVVRGGGPLATQLLDKCIGGHTKTDVGRPWAEEVANVGHRGEGALGRFSVSIVQKPFVFFFLPTKGQRPQVTSLAPRGGGWGRLGQMRIAQGRERIMFLKCDDLCKGPDTPSIPVLKARGRRIEDASCDEPPSPTLERGLLRTSAIRVYASV